MNTPYQPPESDVTTAREKVRYAGFWIRVAASIVDSILIAFITWPLMFLVYGNAMLESDEVFMGGGELLITWVLPAILIIMFWTKKQATPGKMITGIRIVDAATHQPASNGQYIGRYFGYFLSMLVFGLGYLWVAFDDQKRGWHDMLAKTLVVHND